jgi:hypothetical protein
MQDDLEEPLTTAQCRADFATWVQAHPDPLVLHDVDVDGLAAAAMWRRVAATHGWRGALWSATRAGSASPAPPAGGAQVALGAVVIPATRHGPLTRLHPPVDAPANAAWERIGCASVWLWELWRDVVDVSAWDWLAALGCIERAGRVPIPWLVAVRHRCTTKFLRAAARLVDAASRATAYAPELALQALACHEEPRALVDSGCAQVQQLHAMAEAVDAAVDAGRRSTPYLCGRLVVVGAHQPCRVEDLLATAWLKRFAQHIILVGNEAYAPGHVCYAVQARGGMRPLDFLRSVGWPGELGARGCMPLAVWHDLLKRLQVPSEAL